MEKDIDDILLKSFSKSILTDEEKATLENWITYSQENRDVYAELKKYWDHRNHTNNNIKKRVLVKVKKDILAHDNSHKNFQNKRVIHLKPYWQRYFLVAASISIVLGIFFFFNFRQENYSLRYANQEEVVPMFTRKNNRGERRVVKLSDGTVIKLNADSEISFPKKFNKKIREVYLKGEAFFDVKKDSLRPFIIHSSSITTQVLGTSFNIKAYEDEEDISVSVVTGAVEVRDGLGKEKIKLKPKEKAIYNLQTRGLEKSKFDLREVSWKDGKLIFYQSDLKEIINQLERWYGVDIVVDNPSLLSGGLYTESFDDASLKTVLETISFAGGFQFDFTHNTVNIY